MFKNSPIFLLLLSINLVNLDASYDGKIAKDLQNKALVIVPVADATLRSVTTFDSKKNVEDVYNNMSISPQSGPFSCIRVHQLLFNEVVIILQETDKEVEFAVDNIFLDREKKDNEKIEIEKVNTFWTLKKNIKMLTEFQKNLDAIPNSYGNFKNFEIYDNAFYSIWAVKGFL